MLRSIIDNINNAYVINHFGGISLAIIIKIVIIESVPRTARQTRIHQLHGRFLTNAMSPFPRFLFSLAAAGIRIAISLQYLPSIYNRRSLPARSLHLDFVGFKVKYAIRASCKRFCVKNFVIPNIFLAFTQKVCRFLLFPSFFSFILKIFDKI